MTTTDPRHDPHFDQAMRALHAQAVAEVSPAVRARLRSARHAAAPAPERRGLGWVLASGGAAVFALAIGLQLNRTPTPAAPAASPVASESLYDVDTAVAALDEDPDLYLWLASNGDALATAPE